MKIKIIYILFFVFCLLFSVSIATISITGQFAPQGEFTMILDANNVGTGVVNNTEFSYLNNVASAVQTQLNGKQATLASNLTVGALPLTITGGTNAVAVPTVIAFNYDTNDFQLFGNKLQVKDGGITHSGLSGTHNLTTDLQPSWTNIQNIDSEIAALMGLTSAANKLPYFTGSGMAADTNFTTAGRAILDDVNTTAQKNTLGLGESNDVIFENVWATGYFGKNGESLYFGAQDDNEDWGYLIFGSLAEGVYFLSPTSGFIIDLGGDSYFRDLKLNGNAYIPGNLIAGTTSISVAQAKTAYDHANQENAVTGIIECNGAGGYQGIPSTGTGNVARTTKPTLVGPNLGDANATRVNVDNTSTYIDKDGSGNMTLTDAIVGTRTLKQLGCPTYKFIKATTQSEGDLHLSDGTNWAISKALINIIRVKTTSTNWDLYILQNDNGYATDDANIGKMKIMSNGNGNANIILQLPYQDEDASNEVHLYYLDNSGTSTADFYILGLELL